MQCQASMGIGDEGETIPGVEAGTRVRITAPIKVYHAPKQKVGALAAGTPAGIASTQRGCRVPGLLCRGLRAPHALP